MGDCEYCQGDGCYDCPPPEPDYDAIAANRADRDWAAGEPIRWGGLDTPN